MGLFPSQALSRRTWTFLPRRVAPLHRLARGDVPLCLSGRDTALATWLAPLAWLQ